MFTFVSDPIERFLFAVNECYLRNAIPHTLEWKNHKAGTKHRPLDKQFKTKYHTSRKYLEYSSSLTYTHHATQSTAKYILNAILTGDNAEIAAHLLTIPSTNHFYPMSNMLKEFEPDFVGDYTHFLEQWEKVHSFLSVTPTQRTLSH